MIDRFLNILFDDMEYVTKILYEPALLTDDIVYFNPKKLYYIRLEIVLQLIRKDINKYIFAVDKVFKMISDGIKNNNLEILLEGKIADKGFKRLN